MDDHRFDALTRFLALGSDRRALLASLAAISASGWDHLTSDAKKKKKKKKKPKATCKNTNQNCTASSQCCNGLICAGGSFQEECESVDGDVCCLTLGKSCSHTCDCCEAGAECGDDGKCCKASFTSCTTHSDCCGDEFCINVTAEEKECRINNFGSGCDNDDECLGGLICIEEICQCILNGNACTDDEDCCDDFGCNVNGFCGCVGATLPCQLDSDCCDGTCANNQCSF